MIRRWNIQGVLEDGNSVHVSSALSIGPWLSPMFDKVACCVGKLCWSYLATRGRPGL